MTSTPPPLTRTAVQYRTSPTDAFRSDIEGLRAVAVLLVVLFHAGLGFSGGLVGVDVFFVLSGFLITGLLLRELDATGTISLARFYARRVRRLLPAAILVLLVTLLLSIAFLPPLLLPGVAGDVAAAAAYVSNVGFAIQATDYFAAGQAPSPVLHFWSLGVEEQFYLFWPALLLLVAGGARGRGYRVAITVMAVAGVSFALSLWLTQTNQPWAFFSLPTRAWELGLGAILAVTGTRLRATPKPLAAAAGWAGMALILLAGLAINQATPFPGTAALLPTVGAALVVVGGARATRRGPAHLLATRVPRFLGRISYSLYLWHWPLLVIPAAAAGADPPPVARLALVGFAIVLAWVTQSIVEDPLRHGALIGTRPRRNLALAGAVAVLVGSVSLGTGAVTANGLGGPIASPDPSAQAANERQLSQILGDLASEAPASMAPGAGPTSSPTAMAAATSPTVTPRATDPGHHARGPEPATTATPTRPPTPAPPLPSPTPTAPVLAAVNRPATPDSPVPADLQPALGNARRDYPVSYTDGCHTQMDGHPGSGSCLYGNLASRTTIALFGDSHALALFPAMERFAEKQGWRLLSLTMSTCNPATIPIWVPAWNRVSWECNDWRDQAIQELVDTHPTLVVVSGTRGFATTDPTGRTVLSGDARTQSWQAGIARTLAKLVPAAGRVVLMADAPLSRVDPPVCLSEHPTSTLACATPVGDAISASWLAVEQQAAFQAHAGFVDPGRWICPSAPCPVVLGNFLVYRDPGHLTATFAAAISDQIGGALLADLRTSGVPIS
jgi:peptidoglycan/LPS O-acetylase OafA/YrhL